MKKLNILLLFAILGSLGASYPFNWMMGDPNPVPLESNQWVGKQAEIIKRETPNINDKVLRLSLMAYQKARQRGLDQKEVLTVIDFSKPSSEKRLWVFDLKRNKMLYNTWVAHGKNSGGTFATSFSNRPGSLKSSIGVFVTADPYIGNNGYSLRLKGLEPGINDNAYKRSVVVHGATYANEDVIKRNGAPGRSWGCPAVSRALSRPIINTIKQNTVLFAYYPDNKWLSHSQFLTG
jgi:hypothetical protein